MLARVRTVLGIALITLALLELVLQVLAFAHWLAVAPDAIARDASARTVLCVGDSFTFGSGASSSEHAYPAALQRLLRERFGPEWRVVNGGMGGRDSRGVLEELDGQLAACAPAFVCVVIGANDRWQRPEELVPADDAAFAGSTGFRWELRTLRLLRGFGAFDDQARAPTGGLGYHERLVGAWTLGALPVRIDTGGTCNVGGRVGLWQSDGATLVVRGPGLDAEFAIEEVDGGWLLRAGEHEPLPLLPATEAAPPDTPSALGDLAAFRRDWDAAEDAYHRGRSAECGSAEWLACTAGLVEVFAMTERADDAAAMRTELDSAYSSSPSEGALIACLRAAEATRDQPAILRLGAEGTELHPHNERFWRTHAHAAYWLLERDEAIATIDAALAHVGDREPLWKLRASLSAHDTRAALADDILTAWRDTGSAAFLEHLLTVYLEHLDDVDLHAACERATLSATDRHHVLAARRAAREASGHRDVLRRHLARIVQRCRRAGAEPIFDSYPFHRAELETLQHAVATAERVPFAAVSERFAAARHSAPDVDLFVTDGHCNDAGYALMAAAIFEVLRGRIDGH